MIREKLSQGQGVIGTWCEIADPMSINVLARAGLDFVIIDMEHSTPDFRRAHDLVFAAQSDNCAPIIRVSQNDRSEILRALDMDPAGILVPHVRSLEDCRQVVSCAFFPPHGSRGVNPFIRAGNYSDHGAEYFEKQNKKNVVGVILEGERAFTELDEILSVDEINLVYIGAYDLSVALGVPGEINHPRIIEVIKEASLKVKDKEKAVGCMVHTIEDLQFFRNLGVQFVAYKTDTAILFDSFSGFRKEISRSY